jgi:two-component system, sensor histidine kinase
MITTLKTLIHSIPKRWLIASSSILFVMLLVSILAYASLFQYARLGRDLERWEKIIRSIERVVLLVRSAESGQRGYLLTLDENYLKPYVRGIPEINMSLNLRTGDRIIDSKLQDLQLKVRDKVSELINTIELVKQDKIVSAMDIMISDFGRSKMVEIENLANEIVTRITERNNNRKKNLLFLGTASLILLPSVGSIGILTLVFVILVAVKQSQVLSVTKARILEEFSRNERTTTLLNILSHDLGTGLHLIIQRTEIIKELCESGNLRIDNLMKLVTEIYTTTESQTELLKRYLNVVRAEKDILIVKRLRLESLLYDVKQAYDEQLKDKPIIMVVSCPHNICIETDCLKLKQILMNLVSNSIKFTESGRIMLSAREYSKKVTITVEDTGIGIAKDFVPYIFQDFRQEDNPERDPDKGFGLGLAIVRRLIEQLEATIDVASTVGKGTKITVSLPKHIEEKS